MKKIISVLLAMLMLLSLCACGQNLSQTPDTPASGIYYDITGVHPQEIVLSVEGNEVPMELLCYWATYHADSLYGNLLMGYTMGGLYEECFDAESGNLLSKAVPEELGGMTLGEYVTGQTLSTVKLYAAVENLCEELGVDLTEEQSAEMDSAITNAIENLGGEEAFQEMLKEMGVSQDSYLHLIRGGYQFNNLVALVTQEGSALYLEDADCELYRVYADHILLSTADPLTGEAYSQEKQMEQLGRARELLGKLDGLEGEELISTFTELANEHSEDGGRINNNGYVFGTGEMVAEFESAAFSLQPGELSGIVESSYGYHIILRKDIKPMLEADPTLKATIAEEHLPSLVQLYLDEAEITTSNKIKDFDAIEFYNDYLEATGAHASEDIIGDTAANQTTTDSTSK